MIAGRAASTTVEEAPRSRNEPVIQRAGTVVSLAAGLGLIGQFLFHGVGLGVNYPLGIGLLLLAGWLAGGVRRPRLTRDAWLGPAALVYAVFVAIRADPTILLLDIVTSLALAGAACASLAGRPVSARPCTELVGLGTSVAGWIASGAVPAARQAVKQLPSAGGIAERLGTVTPVLRGVLIAAPIMIVFAALFAAADAVFADVLERSLRIDVDVGDLVGRVILATAIAWGSAGVLALVCSVAPEIDRDESLPAASERVPPLGLTEAITVIVSVDVLFTFFVVLQAAYLFGGRDTLADIGITYAEYARRGFFELVAAAMLAGGLIVALDRLARSRRIALVAGCVALAAMSFVVLASAALRLRLYQEAYGWTELRLYVLATIALLGIGIVALVIALITARVRWIGHAVLVTGLVIGLGLNLLGPGRFVAEQNVARVVVPDLVPDHGQSGFDELYVLTLGDDAVPALVRVLPYLPDDRARFVRDELEFRRLELRSQPGLNAWQAWNAGRSAARNALDAASDRGELGSLAP